MNLPARLRLNKGLILCAAILGGILYGYDIGVMSMAVLYIRDAIALSSFELEVLVGTVFIGGIIGSLGVGYLADRYGRKLSIVVACVFFIVGTLLFQWGNTFWALFVARLCLGIGVGFVSVVIPLYTAELAAARSRGRFITLFQLSLTLGILLAYVIDCCLSKGHHWREMFAVIFMPASLLLAVALWLPETPRWLFFHKNKTAAFKALQFIHPTASASRELADIEADHRRHQTLQSTRAKLPIKLIVFVVLLAACNQLIGANAILQYAPYIIKLTGGGAGDLNRFGTVGVGLMNVVFTLVAFMLVDFLGRRPLLVIGVTGVLVANLFLGLVNTLDLSVALKSTLYLGGLLFFICAYAIGPGVVVWLLMSELLPTAVRSKGMAIALLFNSLASVLTTSTFLTVIHYLGLAGLHYLFAAASGVYLVSVLLGLPETKNTVLEKVRFYAAKNELAAELS